MLRLFVDTRFQFLFHSPPGVLFTFPSRYLFTIGHQEYLALEGGPPSFPRGSSCPVVLRLSAKATPTFYLQGSHLLWPAFPCRSIKSVSLRKAYSPSRGHLYPLPATAVAYCTDRVWALPPSLAATRGISVDFFSSGYLDVSVLPLASLTPFSARVARHDPCGVAPFGYLWINACLQLPTAFRSLPRPSSALDAKAFTVCPY